MERMGCGGCVIWLLLLAGLLLAPLALVGRAAEREDFTALLETVRRKHDLPGLAAATVVEGTVGETGATGFRKEGDSTPVTAADRWHIGSCTKSMTATLAALLVVEGKLAWDTTIAAAFPDLTATMRPEYRKVTLRQLLSHHGGIPPDSFPKGVPEWRRAPGTIREQRALYVKLALGDPPVSAPGGKHLYSNRGYVIAGAMMERAAGASWEDLLRQRLFRPLGMASAGFGAPGTPGRVDQPWQHVLRDGQRRPVEPGLAADNPPVLGPAGTAHASIGDWAKYAAFHLRGARGQADLLKRETFALLHTPPGPPDVPEQAEYAFGWLTPERSWAGGRTLHHGGSNTMSASVLWLAPTRGFGVLTAANQGGDLAFKALDEVAGALVGRITRR